MLNQNLNQLFVSVTLAVPLFLFRSFLREMARKQDLAVVRLIRGLGSVAILHVHMFVNINNFVPGYIGIMVTR